jgi:hypothetical protein
MQKTTVRSLNYIHIIHVKKGPSLISEPHQQTMAYKPTLVSSVYPMDANPHHFNLVHEKLRNHGKYHWQIISFHIVSI